jgi:uncharacterized protein
VKLIEATCLNFYVAENRRHRGVLVYEWLLQQAVALGLPGGSAFRAIAGFGRHHRLHEQHFFELAGDVPIEVTFIVDAAEEARLLDVVERAGLSLVLVRQTVTHGVINGEPGASK